MKPALDLEERFRERDREIVCFVDAVIMFLCALGYGSCIVLVFVPTIKGDGLVVVAVFSWFLSAILSFQIAKYLPGLSSYQIFTEFSQAILVLIFLYYAGAAALLLLLKITEPPRLAGVFSASLMFLTAIIKSANKRK
jgi:hypothetical protein